MQRIGIFGGSFNPIHTAHLILAEWVRFERGLQEVLFVPARRPPHKPDLRLAPAEDRMRMVELATRDNPAFGAEAIELRRQGPSYTLRTVRELQQRYGAEARLFLIVGGDSVHELGEWWHAEQLAEEAEFIAVERSGYSVRDDVAGLAERFGQGWARRTLELKVEAPLLEISATAIRERLRAGRTIRYLVPESVRNHILENRLYAED